MKSKSDLLRAYPDDEDRLLAARCLDKAVAAERSSAVTLGDFCDPRQAALVAELIRRRDGESLVSFEGGYPEAERCRPAFFTDSVPPTPGDYDLCLIRVDGDFGTAVSHRDVLGAVLALGIKREKLGDIIVDEQGCYLITVQEMAAYLANNITQIHRLQVHTEEVPWSQLANYQRPYRETTTVVASLRLDAVGAAAFGMSRSETVAEIEGHKVKLNWKDCDDPSHAVKEGDVLSLRGKGRAVLKEVVGETKKGRIRLTVARPL